MICPYIYYIHTLYLQLIYDKDLFYQHNINSPVQVGYSVRSRGAPPWWYPVPTLQGQTEG